MTGGSLGCDAMTRTRVAIALVLAGVLGCGLAGCASRPTSTGEFAVPGDQYAPTFDAARTVLLDWGFEIQRVDARSGVITTFPKESGGLATPQDRDQSSAADEFEDFLNLQSRTVRVEFVSPSASPEVDLRTAGGDLTMRVRAIVWRRHRPGWRLEPSGVTLSTWTTDPELANRGMAGNYVVAVRRDHDLEARVAAAIHQSMPASPR